LVQVEALGRTSADTEDAIDVRSTRERIPADSVVVRAEVRFAAHSRHHPWQGTKDGMIVRRTKVIEVIDRNDPELPRNPFGDEQCENSRRDKKTI
jgi:hypothetical protein